LNDPNVVSVFIAGEEYTLRARATPEYTRECAAYVDRTIAEIMKSGSLAGVDKAAILAALAITDELFQAKRAEEEQRAAAAERAQSLASRVEAHIAEADLAGPSRG
jgi:cell division protein ZapA